MMHLATTHRRSLPRRRSTTATSPLETVGLPHHRGGRLRRAGPRRLVVPPTWPTAIAARPRRTPGPTRDDLQRSGRATATRSHCMSDEDGPRGSG